VAQPYTPERAGARHHHGTMRRGTVRHTTVQHSTAQCGTVRRSTAQYGTGRRATPRAVPGASYQISAQFNTIWYGTVPGSTAQRNNRVPSTDDPSG